MIIYFKNLPIAKRTLHGAGQNMIEIEMGCSRNHIHSDISF